MNHTPNRDAAHPPTNGGPPSLSAHEAIARSLRAGAREEVSHRAGLRHAVLARLGEHDTPADAMHRLNTTAWWRRPAMLAAACVVIGGVMVAWLRPTPVQVSPTTRAESAQGVQATPSPTDELPRLARSLRTLPSSMDAPMQREARQFVADVSRAAGFVRATLPQVSAPSGGGAATRG